MEPYLSHRSAQEGYSNLVTEHRVESETCALDLTLPIVNGRTLRTVT